MRSGKFLFIALLALAACSKKDPETSCSTYFLSELHGGLSVSKLFYNGDKQLATIEVTNGGADFIYTDKVLQKVAVKNATYLFRYSSDGKMIATLTVDANNSKKDSIEYIYDASNHMVRRNFYTPGPNYASLYKYVLYTYTGDNPTKVDFYEYRGTGVPFELTGTFKYTFDSHPRPYPKEYDMLSIASSNTNAMNNITSTQVIRYGIGNSTEPGKVDITYNQAGYPLHNAGDGYDYVYSCAPPTK